MCLKTADGIVVDIMNISHRLVSSRLASLFFLPIEKILRLILCSNWSIVESSDLIAKK